MTLIALASLIFCGFFAYETASMAAARIGENYRRSFVSIIKDGLGDVALFCGAASGVIVSLRTLVDLWVFA